MVERGDLIGRGVDEALGVVLHRLERMETGAVELLHPDPNYPNFQPSFVLPNFQKIKHQFNEANRNTFSISMKSPHYLIDKIVQICFQITLQNGGLGINWLLIIGNSIGYWLLGFDKGFHCCRLG